MIATTSRRSVAARSQWTDPRARVRLLAGQILAAERRRVDRLVRDNLHLLDLASGFFHRKFPMIPRDDLRQAGFFGLRRAAELFDATKGAQFHTWAFFWLRDAINREFFHMGSGVIRVPKRATSPAPKVTSLDAQRDDGATFGALLVDDDPADPLNEAHRADLRERVATVLGTLLPRRALVIELRFGINGAAYPHSYAEIATRLGVCKQRARQLEHLALDDLREALAAFAE